MFTRMWNIRTFVKSLFTLIYVHTSFDDSEESLVFVIEPIICPRSPPPLTSLLLHLVKVLKTLSVEHKKKNETHFPKYS